MSDNKNLEHNFVGYEYKTVIVPKELDGLWTDSLKSFGWELEKKNPAVVKHLWGPLRVMMAPLSVFGGKFKEFVTDHDSATRVELTFKRDRSMPGKAELSCLQPQFENCARSIESLEQSKTAGAAIASAAIGLVGTVFLALATFAFLSGMTPACILLAVPGILGWIVPFFAYRSIKAGKTKKVDPLIQAQLDNIYAACRKAAEVTAAA